MKTTLFLLGLILVCNIFASDSTTSSSTQNSSSSGSRPDEFVKSRIEKVSQKFVEESLTEFIANVRKYLASYQSKINYQSWNDVSPSQIPTLTNSKTTASSYPIGTKYTTLPHIPDVNYDAVQKKLFKKWTPKKVHDISVWPYDTFPLIKYASFTENLQFNEDMQIKDMESISLCSLTVTDDRGQKDGKIDVYSFTTQVNAVLIPQYWWTGGFLGIGAVPNLRTWNNKEYLVLRGLLKTICMVDTWYSFHNLKKGQTQKNIKGELSWSILTSNVKADNHATFVNGFRKKTNSRRRLLASKKRLAKKDQAIRKLGTNPNKDSEDSKKK